MKIVYPSHNYPDTIKNCLGTILKVIGKMRICYARVNVFVLMGLENCLKNPTEEKFRKINKENPAFKARVGDIVGGIFILEALGFQVNSEGFLVLDSVDNKLFEEAAAKIKPHAV